MFFLALLIALLLAGMLVDFVTGHRRLRALADIAPVRHGPSVSLIVAARNEERNIEEALRSLLALDYSPLEIIVVNDRSTDGTAAVLQRLVEEHPHLKVVHITELPKGWLGKTHALHTGAAAASGELLLFADADVVLDPTTLGRAVAFMQQEELDHLTAIPHVQVRGILLRAFVAAFGVFFTVYSRPWKARDPRSRHHIGVGAFNLIRAAAYRQIGGHRGIAMRPDDDMKLGKMVKKAGFRQDVTFGRGLVMIEWYASLGGMIDGLMKNAFAGVNYSVASLVFATVGLLLTNVWPFLALFLTTGATRLVYALAALLVMLIFWTHARHAGTGLLYVACYPFAAVLFAYVMWRSALLALTRGTVIWRGTAYPLADLRANKV